MEFWKKKPIVPRFIKDNPKHLNRKVHHINDTTQQTFEFCVISLCNWYWGKTVKAFNTMFEFGLDAEGHMISVPVTS